MQRILSSKLLAIAGISLLILIALNLIESQINARSNLQESVLRNIAESSAGQQLLVGPMLLLRYRTEVDEPHVDKEGQVSTRRRVVDQEQLVAPSQLSIRGSGQVETRNRGIYRGQIYHLGLNITGEVSIPEWFFANAGRSVIAPKAYLITSVSDLRGVDNLPQMEINGKKYKLQTGNAKLCAGRCTAGERMYVELGDAAALADRKLSFSLPLNLTGTQNLAIAPVAENNNIELKSDWQHPSFGGRFLPRQREVGKDGFVASWQISHLSRNFDKAVQGDREFLQVTLMDPVNVYLLAIRAVKYGILFVLLTFGGFFITETLRRSPIHPVQYLLVGMALSIFFMLLIALSEHMAFHLAYLIAATACIGLISYYLAGALGGWRPGLGFGAGLTGLYGVLYGILHSEDNALLTGTLLLFLALGAVMVGTRKFDWYQLGNDTQNRSAS